MFYRGAFSRVSLSFLKIKLEDHVDVTIPKTFKPELKSEKVVVVKAFII